MQTKRAIILNCILFMAGVLSLVYYLSCGFYVRFGLSALWLWLVIGVGAITKAAVSLWLIKQEYLENRIGEKKSSLLKKGGKILWILIGIFLAVFIIIQGLIIGEMNKKTDKNMDYIIVLGAAVRGERPSLVLRKRINTAFQYLEDNQNTIVIASGGQGSGENISEGECIKRELMGRGIDGNRILIEDKSTTTSENIENSYAIIGKRDVTVGIVTNNFHVYRAVSIAKKLTDDKVEGIVAPFWHLLLPHYMMRESLGVMADIMKGNI